MEISTFTLGADPELFIVDTSKDNKVISSVGIIPGIKGAPCPVEELGEGYGMEIDNILAEYNIPPATDKESFILSIENMKNHIREYVKKINPDYDIMCVASRFVDDDQLQTPEAKLFGCSVDYNAYTMGQNPKPKGETTNLRSAGFHIHIGYYSPNIECSLSLVKCLDVALGIPSLLFDNDQKRRSLYGKAGCFRLTSYGVEYRTLSSKMHDHLEFLWNGVLDAVSLLNNCNFFDGDIVQSIINNNLVEEAEKFIKNNKECYYYNEDLVLKTLLNTKKN